MAVPVWCEVVAKFGGRSHGPLLGLLAEIELSRLRFQPLLAGRVGARTIAAYEVGLAGLLPHLPGQLRLLSDTTQEGFRAVESILALFAHATGQPWVAGMLRGGLPLVDMAGHLTPQVENVARRLGRDDLPESLRTGHRDWREHQERVKEEPGPEF
ncbi:hypothetical protein [Deinococcus apachensis]|uniref:hypothetical protein n=1 Tax=Deinococcus apachensis TaxID=309886 RepID=UPI00035F8C01|nr:hypothetical protein [Deinococcus apachensis]